ncbi:MAG: non-homologous end-joining DNA ligase [Acidimicrobiia bacterium]|nr:non-homologous end-joining DNA ligase [Acidimicrobiia bacterium]
MKATSTDRVPTGSGWAAEIKWDGMRIEATITGATDGHPPAMVLRSSNGRDVTGSFPELAGLAEALHADAVLDGEVVVFDGDRPSFARLQQRIHIDRPHPSLVEAHPVVYIVFDLLRLDGNLLIDLPYVTRRRLLNDLLPDGANWRTPPFIDDDPESLLELAAERDLEGIVVKRLDSVYEPGMRSSAWRKIKIRRRQEFVVGGWLEGQRSLEKQIGSLMVGVWDDGRLVMAGRVGSGLTEVERTRLEKLLVATDEPPFAEVPPLDKRPVWVEPTVVVEVEYGEWPPGGQLRHPVYRGLRIDRDPAEVTRE